MLLRTWLVASLLGLAAPNLRAHPDHAAAEEMSRAASAWLNSLDAALRARAVFQVQDGERENWHFVPRSRQGVPLRDLTEPQRQLARNLVAAGLSQRGALTVDAIVALEDVLRVVEGSARRDRELYFFTVFGQPGVDRTWGWRLEGHHLSVSFLVHADGQVAATPMFFGANPAEVRVEHPQKGHRALVAEEDLARELLALFDEVQRRTVVISERAPGDIVTGADREAKLAAPSGLPLRA